MEIISRKEAKKTYIRAFGVPFWRILISDVASLMKVGGIFRLVDAQYRVITDADERRFLRLLETDRTDREKWVQDFHDCDDFAFRLFGVIHQDIDFAGMPFFILWVEWTDTKRHGHYVVSYIKDGKVNVVEPQDDNVMDVPRHWRLREVFG